MTTPTFNFDIIGKFPTHKISKPIYLGPTVTQVRVNIVFTGTPILLLSGDGGSNWQEVIGLVSGVSQNVTITNTGTEFLWKLIGKPGTDSVQYPFEIENIS